MSHYYSLYCEDCNTAAEGEINRGERVLSAIVAAYPYIQQMNQAVESARGVMGEDAWRLEPEISLIGYESDSVLNLWRFLESHRTHHLTLKSEYPSYPREPLIDVGAKHE